MTLISFPAFRNKWLGGHVDYDHVFEYQCVDLILQGLYEMHGIGKGVWGNAIDYWVKPTPTLAKYFNKIHGSAAKVGDIVVLWGLPGNPYGHIGWATGNLKADTVEILEQNGATGSGHGEGGDRVRTRWVARSRVAGLLRRKPVAPVLPSVIKVASGWGLSNVAKAAGFKDWWLPTRWQAISNLNHGGLWPKFNASLKPGQLVRVR